MKLSKYWWVDLILYQKQHLVNSSKTLSLPPPARRRALGEQRVQRVGHVHLVLRRLDLLHRRHDGRKRCRCRLLQARQVVKIKGRRLVITVITSPSCSGKADFSWTTSWWSSGRYWWAPQRPLEVSHADLGKVQRNIDIAHHHHHHHDHHLDQLIKL